MEKVPPGHVYPLAGLFMLEVLDMAGPQTVKNMLSCTTADAALKELKTGLWSKGISVEQFWAKFYQDAWDWAWEK